MKATQQILDPLVIENNRLPETLYSLRWSNSKTLTVGQIVFGLSDSNALQADNEPRDARAIFLFWRITDRVSTQTDGEYRLTLENLQDGEIWVRTVDTGSQIARVVSKEKSWRR